MTVDPLYPAPFKGQRAELLWLWCPCHLLGGGDFWCGNSLPKLSWVSQHCHHLPAKSKNPHRENQTILPPTALCLQAKKSLVRKTQLTCYKHPPPVWDRTSLSSYIDQADHSLTEIHLPLPSKCWDKRRVPPCQATKFFTCRIFLWGSKSTFVYVLSISFNLGEAQRHTDFISTGLCK